MLKKIIKVISLLLIIIIIMNYENVLKKFFPTDYQEIVTTYAEKYNLDPYLVYSIIKVESGFDASAKSYKGAIGLMQIMPQTGEYISNLLGEQGFTEGKLYDPEINIRYGTYYFSKLYKNYYEDLDMALAAYNGGEGNVRRWIREDSEGKKYIDMNDLMFEETRKYLYKVKKNYLFYRYIYENYGFNVINWRYSYVSVSNKV
ncbi:MAG TPA: lytic transglycosylase [Clostridiales bacterium]|nr:lytic transglycosylase [Clostridiales bacterium]